MEDMEEFMKKIFEKPEYLILAEALGKMGKVKRTLRIGQKNDLIVKEEFYCPHCQRRTKMQEIPTRSKKKILYSILVCDKCFTFLSKM